MNWPEFRRDERGNMAVLFAFGFAVSAVVSAVAVDAAALYHERRLMQAGVDLASISAAADPSRAVEIAQSVLAGARLLAPASTDGLTVITGHYDKTAPDIASRFAPHALPLNAVAVTLERPGTLHFAAGFAPVPAISATGVAAVTPEVSFSVGSRLASLHGGLANAVLSDLLGTSVSLSVADYAALADARVNALTFLDVLALQMGTAAGTYDELLAMEADAGVLAATLAELSSGPLRTALQSVVMGGAGHSVPLAGLVSLGRLGGMRLGSGGAAPISLSMLEILTAAAALSDGDRQVSLNLGAGVPGLLSLRLDLSVGEPPQGGGWFAIGPIDTVLHTAQIRLRLRAEMLGGPVLLGAAVKLPLWLDLAHAEARVIAATCPSPATPNGSASIAVRPGLARFALGELSDAALYNFGATPTPGPAQLINGLLLKVTGSAFVEIAQATPIALSFSSADIGAGMLKTASTQTLVSSLTGSLLGELDLSVNVLGLGLASPSVVAQAVRNLLAPLAPTLDLAVAGILSALGLGVGEADIRVYGVRCDHAVLVG
ncbi:TadG family pilus assembly protein [Devosia sp. CAU 1758]